MGKTTRNTRRDHLHKPRKAERKRERASTRTYVRAMLREAEKLATELASSEGDHAPAPSILRGV